MKLFLGVHHVLMRLLDSVEFRLLIRRQDWSDLRQRVIDYGSRFLHRLLMNGGNLRFGLIENRLNLGLLISRQIQLVGEFSKAECVAVRAPRPGVSLGLANDKTAERDRTGGHNC